ncbi:hypothetical protein LINGRAHAP2_LOCUS34878 [Linum grandiflorum]
MKFLAWNCRGIGGSLVKDTLPEITSHYHLAFLFLSETKSTQDDVVSLLQSLRYLTHGSSSPFWLGFLTPMGYKLSL